MYGKIQEILQQQLQGIKDDGLYKNERVITTPQRVEIETNGQEVLNFCANNYLGLSNHPRLVQAAKDAMDTHGFGLSSVRFICGTQDIHKELEKRISDYFGTEDTILYIAAFDANGGVFEPILTEDDAIISDSLNHASIIDGVRLCKAQRYRYKNADMADLEEQLKLAQAHPLGSVFVSPFGVNTTISEEKRLSLNSSKKSSASVCGFSKSSLTCLIHFSNSDS